MTKAEAKKRIEVLRKAVTRYRYLYHVKDIQEISEAALDSLKHELATLEDQFPELITSDSPTQRVAGEPLAKFKKHRHEFPMRSLHDVFTFQELVEWEARMKKVQPTGTYAYYAEVKMDGLAIELVYEDGLLARGLTRGDGVIGEDVTLNVRTIEAIPLRLELERVKDAAVRANIAKHVVVRGEVYMRKDVFEELNRQFKTQGKKLIANPRNGAAGSIRQLNPKLTASRRLDFMAYDIPSALGLQTHEELHQLLGTLGFATAKANTLCKNLEGVKRVYESLIRDREKLPYWTDGVVVNINSNKLFSALGVVGKGPRGARAWKYPAEEATTVVKNITVQIGRTGVLTPVAEFEPVQIGGTTVVHATLHNFDEIQRLGVKVGDTVIVKKAGDVIPKVIKVLKEMRRGTEKAFRMPKTCPVCGGDVVQPKGEVNYYCSNPACVTKHRERLYHFVSKDALDIEGVGPKIIDKFFDEGFVRTFADLYNVTEEEIQSLPGFQEVSAKKIVAAIQTKRRVPLHRLLIALGIRHAGEETAYDVANYFGTLVALRKATTQDFEAIPNIGPVVSKSLSTYFASEAGKKEIDALIDVGVEVESAKKIAGGIFNGKSVVITGTLQGYSRDELKALVRTQGGNPSGSVSAKTDMVIVGENPGSKYTKAKELGIPILDEKALKQKLAE